MKTARIEENMASTIIKVALALHRYRWTGTLPVLFLGSDLWPVPLPLLAERFLRRMGDLRGDMQYQQIPESDATDTTTVLVEWHGLSESEFVRDWLELFNKRWAERSLDEQFIFLDEQFQNAGRSEALQMISEWIIRGYFDIIFTTDISPNLEDILVDRGLRRRDVLPMALDIYSVDQIQFAVSAPVPKIKIIKLNGDLYSWAFWISPLELSHHRDQQEALIRALASTGIVSIGHDHLLDVGLEQIAKQIKRSFISMPASSITCLAQWLTIFQSLPERSQRAILELPPDLVVSILQAHSPDSQEALVRMLEAEWAKERQLVQLIGVVEILDKDQSADERSVEGTSNGTK